MSRFLYFFVVCPANRTGDLCRSSPAWLQRADTLASGLGLGSTAMLLLLSHTWCWLARRLPELHPLVFGVGVVRCLVHQGSFDFGGCTKA